MTHRAMTVAIAIGLCGLTAPVLADHNSKNGEGWANMPNDIHNTRVETLEANENEAFREFVKHGEGSRTINRFDSDDTQPGEASSSRGNTGVAAKESKSVRNTRDEVGKHASAPNQARRASRPRMESRVSRMSRTTAPRTSMRAGGGGRRGSNKQ